MQLCKLEYMERRGTPSEWRLLPFALGPTNLVVGRNASGKSRTLKLIHSLAQRLRTDAQTVVHEGCWSVEFEHDRMHYAYDLHIAGGVVQREQLAIDLQITLERGSDGVGQIDAEEAPERKLRFQVPQSIPAAVAKRDMIQHPFLEPLHAWSRSLRYYQFGAAMGQDVLAVFHEKGTDPDPAQSEQVVALFQRGSRQFPAEFVPGIMRYMAQIGYDIEDAQIAALTDISISTRFETITPSGIAVKERGLPTATMQTAMSTGMFRALSIITHLRYAELASIPSCILIDDIGEGLDFERASALIKLLVERSEAHKVQLIMATNDRFVMNSVPLECWAILERKGSVCTIHNYENSREKFEEFKLTGLSNFDLFSTNYVMSHNE